TNSDGQISLAEFQAGSKKPEKAKAKFEKLDANHDGQLDKSEIAAAKKHGKKDGAKKEGKKGGGKKHGGKKNKGGKKN
ncbi:MAG: calcium-binding protein, partial [Verrucomicrobiales bacterium VVV1]